MSKLTLDKVTEKDRKNFSIKLQNFCMFAEDHSTLEMCKWANEEGFDISFRDNEIISLTYGELDALTSLYKHLKKL